MFLKRPVLQIVVAPSFLHELFSSHIHCTPNALKFHTFLAYPRVCGQYTGPHTAECYAYFYMRSGCIEAGHDNPALNFTATNQAAWAMYNIQ